jgi:hypothetical protein
MMDVDIKDSPLFHYYGDIVRRLFLASGLIMVFSIPLFSHFIPVPSIFSLSIVLTLVLLAGYTSPKKKKIMLFNIIASSIAIITFGMHATFVASNSHKDWHQKLFLLVLYVLIFLFFFALYYSTKTYRAMSSKN